MVKGAGGAAAAGGGGAVTGSWGPSVETPSGMVAGREVRGLTMPQGGGSIGVRAVDLAPAGSSGKAADVFEKAGILGQRSAEMKNWRELTVTVDGQPKRVLVSLEDISRWFGRSVAELKGMRETDLSGVMNSQVAVDVLKRRLEGELGYYRARQRSLHEEHRSVTQHKRRKASPELLQQMSGVKENIGRLEAVLESLSLEGGSAGGGSTAR